MASAPPSQSTRTVLVGAQVENRSTDVVIESGIVAAIESGSRPRASDTVIDARGGALLPGLHDHHLHLLAEAAAARSVACGPPQVRNEAQLRAALRGAPGDGWVRGVGYHESVAGALDRARLDAWVPNRPVRIQHRTGALWMLSSRALAALGSLAGVPGVERDANGAPTGRLFRADRLLRERIPPESQDLAELGARLASLGVTGVSDATAHNGSEELALLTEAADRGDLPQCIWMLGSESLPSSAGARTSRGPLKVLLDDSELPELGALAARLKAAHAAGRACAIHCVTRAQLFLALAALEDAGAREGDRIEHASLAPPETLPRLAALRATVVTQPAFVHARGDDYLRDVDPSDQPWLYRLRAFDEAGVPLAAGTDAPYGPLDPWLAMCAAVERRTQSGTVLGAGEAITPERALALFTTPLESPGDRPRMIAPGIPADLCLLHVPWQEARTQLSRALVAATWIGGRFAWRSRELRS